MIVSVRGVTSAWPRVFESAPSGAAEAAREARVASTELLELLYRQMRSLAGPRQDLDDLVQSAAERALRALPSFEGRSAFSTWTYGVAYRTLLDHERWFGRWRRRFAAFEDARSVDLTAPADTERLTLELERARRLHAALTRLPAPKRAVIVLHDLEGLALDEVATIVGANPRTVRSRLRDARHKLGAWLCRDPAFDSEARR